MDLNFKGYNSLIKLHDLIILLFLFIIQLTVIASIYIVMAALTSLFNLCRTLQGLNDMKH